MNDVEEAYKCPVCLEMMWGDILQCTDGHSFCVACRKRMTVCPICRVQLPQHVNIRNLTLRQHRDGARFACPREGCGRTDVVGSDYLDHVERCRVPPCPECNEQLPTHTAAADHKCPRAPTRCLLCGDTMPLDQMAQHTREVHRFHDMVNGRTYTVANGGHTTFYLDGIPLTVMVDPTGIRWRYGNPQAARHFYVTVTNINTRTGDGNRCCGSLSMLHSMELPWPDPDQVHVRVDDFRKPLVD